MQLSSLFSNLPLSSTVYHVQIVPHGKEEGIPYFLIHASDFQHSYVFILDSIQFLGEEPVNTQILKWASIKTTSGQPKVFNSIISREFSTPYSIETKKEKIPTIIDSFQCGQFEINWMFQFPIQIM